MLLRFLLFLLLLLLLLFVLGCSVAPLLPEMIHSFCLLYNHITHTYIAR